MNYARTAILMAAMTGLFLALGWALGGQQGMTIALVVALGMNFFSYWFSDRMVLRMYGAREVGPQEAPRLHSMVAALAARASMPMPRVYVIETDQPNAFATGRNPENAAVAATTGLLRMLDEREVAAVMAHELAHVKNRDTLISCVSATVAGIFSMLAQTALFFGVPRSNGEGGGGHPLAGIAIIILGSIGAALIQAMISRSREYVADADGAAIAGSPDGLMSALRKLDAMSRRIPLENPNPAMNQMFIVEPFCGEKLTNLFATHPPTEERVAALMTLRPGRTVA